MPSPKRGFVSLIAGIAILGLALGVAVLIVVLSVMNGFEEELRTRILSVTAHATITGLEGRIADWRPQLSAVAHFPGVLAAAPYIEEQAMMTHGRPLRRRVDARGVAGRGAARRGPGPAPVVRPI